MEKPVRKRRRPAVACTECRRRKVKCDRSLPCKSCVLGSLPCAYSSTEFVPQDKGYLGHSAATQDFGFNWDTLSYLPTPDRNPQRIYGQTLESSGVSASRSVPGNISNVSHQNAHSASSTNHYPAIGFADIGNDVYPEYLNPSIDRLTGTDNLDVPTSLGLSRTTNHTPNLWKNVFLDACRAFPHSVGSKKEHVKPSQWEEGLKNMVDDPELPSLLDKCKHLSETIRLQRSTQRRHEPSLPNPAPDIPARAICDKLVELYFRTFDTVFRVLHVPTFQQEYNAYWSDTLTSKKGFHQKLLLIMAIGTCFYYQSEEQECSLRSIASRWIFQVQQWLVSGFEMSEPNLDVLQVSCLLLLARQVDRVGTDLVWISADFPLRIAFSEGYHKEPSVHFPDMPPFEAEMRRRIWATSLELALQSSLDAGMPPPIFCDGFDCHPPSDVDDDEIHEKMEALATVNPTERFTQSSVQIMLMRTVRLRINILQSLTTLKDPLSYQDALKLGLDVEALCRSHSMLIQSGISTSSPAGIEPNRFQVKLLDNLTRRFILALHGPFAAQAKTDLSYYFSQRVVAESAFRILNYPPPPFQPIPTPLQDGDYLRLQIFGGGIFRNTIWHAIASLCAELLDDATESSYEISHSSSRRQFLEVIRKHMDVLRRQKKAGDMDSEAFTLFSCAVAQISAQLEGNSSGAAIIKTAKSSLGFCCSILEAEIDRTHGSLLRDDRIDSQTQGADDGLTSWDSMLHVPTTDPHTLFDINDLGQKH